MSDPGSANANNQPSPAELPQESKNFAKGAANELESVPLPPATPRHDGGTGFVSLVGAGPGDPELLTLKGAKCLAAAEVVLYDGLTNPQLLELAPLSAQRICVGKHGQSRVWSQSEINDEMLKFAKQGLRVVRLKGGDPAVFARSAEELEALRSHQIPCEVVPGITAALALGAYTGIPLTHRYFASAVAFVTGQQQADEQPNSLDWQALARFPGTLVLYMGVTTAANWSQQLMAHGKARQTPAALVRRCSWPDQQVIRCRLDEVADLLTPATKMRPPVLVVIGEVAELDLLIPAPVMNPLSGVGVLVPRALQQSDEAANLLAAMGATPWVQPLIEILPPEDFAQVDEAIHALANFDWLIFSSTNGVDAFFTRLWHLGLDVRRLHRLKIATVGGKTAEALERRGLRCDIIPQRQSAEGLVHALSPYVAGQRILSLRADRGTNTLQNGLTTAGAIVTDVAIYRSVDVAQIRHDIIPAIQDGRIGWAILSSSAMAANFNQHFQEFKGILRIASISPLTSKTLKSLNWNVDAEAEAPNMKSLIKAICDAANT